MPGRKHLSAGKAASPAHDLKQFHARYVDKEAFDKKVEAAAKLNGAGLHRRYRPGDQQAPESAGSRGDRGT